MKLSFSTNRWQNYTFEDFIDIAKEYKFNGIEIHDISGFAPEKLSAIYHKLIENKLADRSKIFELLALINEELWVGHFSYWTEQNTPVFKHSLFLDYDDELFEHKIAQMIDIAIKECERMYPIFKVVLTKGMDPKQALYPMLMETAGQA